MAKNDRSYSHCFTLRTWKSLARKFRMKYTFKFSFPVLFKVFDEHIKYFDVYKVESSNEKYMVASRVPSTNGNI